MFDEAFLICSSAAKAAWEYTKKPDWEYTKWGMTPQQVVSASKNLATEASDLRPDSDGNVTKLVAPYQSGKFSFEAQFGFDATDRLASVTLVLNDKAAGMDMGADTNMDHGVCYHLLVSVNAAYGPPQGGGSVHMQYSIETWQDQKNKNNVTYTVLDGVGCYVQYSAINRTANGVRTASRGAVARSILTGRMSAVGFSADICCGPHWASIGCRPAANWSSRSSRMAGK
jgi:hypothetical protein